MSDCYLTVRRTDINGTDDDYLVIWHHDRWGQRRVGRIRLAIEHNETRWLWSINPPLRVPSGMGNGQAETLDGAKADIKAAWAHFVELHGDGDWVRRLGSS